MENWAGRLLPIWRKHIGATRGIRTVQGLLLAAVFGVLAACSNGVGGLPVGDASPEIFYSSAAEGAAPSGASLRALDGSTVSGSVFVFVQEHPAITGAELYYDDPEGQGTPLISMAAAPFGATLDTTRLENGNHTLTAVVRLEGASELVQTAEFEVQNEASDPGEPGDAVEPAPQPAEADYYVATDGSDSNDGTSEDSPFRTIQKAADVVEPGDTVYIRGGVYTDLSIHFAVSGTAEEPITFQSYPGEWAIIDGSDYQDLSGEGIFLEEGLSWNVFRDLEIRNMPGDGIFSKKDNDHNVFENIVSHHNYYTGMSFRGSYNQFINVVAYGNYDYETGGEHADGIAVGRGTGNTFRNCLVYNNADDGIDLWMSSDSLIENTVAHSNGVGTNGNGNGFKLGGSSVGGGHTVRNSIAYNNRASGFDHNTAGSVLTMINNTAYNNGRFNFDLGSEVAHVVKNNLAYDGENYVQGAVVSISNSWDLGMSDPGFASTDPGSSDFLTLAQGSPAIDAGIDLGLPYSGSAPDLGAIEYGTNFTQIGPASLGVAGLAEQSLP